jgi:hypothetical protein
MEDRGRHERRVPGPRARRGAREDGGDNEASSGGLGGDGSVEGRPGATSGAKEDRAGDDGSQEDQGE